MERKLISKSPQRNTFQKEKYLERQAEKGKKPENDEDTRAMVEYYESWDIREDQQEQDPAWRKDNLEWGPSQGGLQAAIDGTLTGYEYFKDTISVITALRERLAQPEQKPFCYHD